MTAQGQAQFVYIWASEWWEDQDDWYHFSLLRQDDAIVIAEFVGYMTHDDWKIYGNY